MDELICPECGGVIGGSKTAGVQACKCFASVANRVGVQRSTVGGDEKSGGGSNFPALTSLATSSSARVSDAPESNDDSIASPPTSSAPQTKTCVACGKALAGVKRVKTPKGYFCLPCDLENRSQDADKVRCRECKRKVKESALVDFRGTMICKRCFADHRDDERPKIVPIKIDEKTNELKKLYVIGAILAVLGMIILLSATGVIGRN